MPKTFARKGLSGIGIALVIFAAAPLMGLVPAGQAKADSEPAAGGRVFELRVYHVLPGKMAMLEGRFRDITSKLLARHGLDVVGYWVADDNSFVFLLAHKSREDAKKNWDALRADPEFQAVMKSEQADKTADKFDVTYMDPTDFSPLR